MTMTTRPRPGTGARRPAPQATLRHPLGLAGISGRRQRGAAGTGPQGTPCGSLHPHPLGMGVRVAAAGRRGGAMVVVGMRVEVGVVVSHAA
jgi:hypothetical protein